MTDAADSNIVPFGKYRGQPVEVMLADRPYCEWALAQPGIRERYPTFVTIVVNGGSAPDAPTPEHNRLQLLFLDPAMQVAAYRAVIDKKALDEATVKWLGDNSSVMVAGDDAALAVIDEEIVAGRFTPCGPIQRGDFVSRGQNWDTVWSWPRELSGLFPRQGWDSDYSANKLGWTSYRAGDDAINRVRAAAQRAASFRRAQMLKDGEAWRLVDEAIGEAGVEFEVRGWDVRIAGPKWMAEGLCIELKPQMGDDFPAVLRAMKARPVNGRRALIVDHFEAESATLDDVRRFFGVSEIAVRTLAEIRAAMPK